MINHIDLFSGIGGFSLAASWVWGEEHNPVLFCEIEKFPQQVLKKHWPNVPIHDDIKTLDARQYWGTINLLTGGFPCQPFSLAGKRGGAADDRALWPEMLRVIEECRPRWIVGHSASIGRDSAPIAQPRKDRESTREIRGSSGVVADAAGDRRGFFEHEARDVFESRGGAFENIGDRNSEICWWPPEPGLGRVLHHGIPRRVDRLRSLGNAIVPQVAAEIFRAIKEIDE